MYLYMICGNIKIKIRAILKLYIKMGVVTKISIKCKALDASPMFSALLSNAILNILS